LEDLTSGQLVALTTLVVAFAAAPTPTPFPLGTLVPFGSPNGTTPAPLPAIGRVRSTGAGLRRDA